MRRGSGSISVPRPCSNATSAGGGSTPWRWASPPTASTACSPTAPTCCARSAISVSASLIACPISSACSSAKPRAWSATCPNCCAARRYDGLLWSARPRESGDPAKKSALHSRLRGNERTKKRLLMTFDHIAVIGGGAWGTALALTCARAGRKVTLWEHNAKNSAQLADKRESLFLPGVRLDDGIALAGTLDNAARADAILLVVPAQAVRAAAAALGPLLKPRTPVIVCAKGIERGSKKFMSEIVAECAPNAVPAILSGPSFAADVARGLPTAVTLAASDGGVAQALAQAIGSAAFRPYHSTDLRGVEIGGAAKNVLAIAAGVVAGRGLGASAAAALTTRGFAELVRFGRAYGARPETMMGLSGLGDLILTCTSPQSRNFSFGANLGRGQKPSAIKGGLAEGTFTAAVLLDRKSTRSVDMPIAAAVAALLAETMTLDEAIKSLLTRPLKAEE